MRVVDKCAGVWLNGPSSGFRDAAVAMFVARRNGSRRKVYEDLEAEVRALPEGQRAVVHAGSWTAPIDLQLDTHYTYTERVERDVVIGGVHEGARICSVEILDTARNQKYTLHCDLPTSIDASKCYTREAIIVADVEIQLDTHKVIGGRLHHVVSLNRDWNVDEVAEWMKSEFDPGKLKS
jgi:hypothetical protein